MEDIKWLEGNRIQIAPPKKTKNVCIVCEHCDSERTNDLEQVRCKRFSTFVDALNWCDILQTKTKRR